MPGDQIPGETIDGAPMFRLILTERARAGSLIVDGRGRRFVNEAQNYNDFGRTLQDFDPARFAFPHVPAWLIFDGTYRATYRLGPLCSRDPDPDGWRTARRSRGWPSEIDVRADELEATVARFNEGAARGEDPDFGRGSFPYDRFIGEIGPLERRLLRASSVLPGA